MSRGVGVHVRGAPDGESAPDSWSGASVEASTKETASDEQSSQSSLLQL